MQKHSSSHWFWLETEVCCVGMEWSGDSRVIKDLSGMLAYWDWTEPEFSGMGCTDVNCWNWELTTLRNN